MSIAYLDPGNIESDLQAGSVAQYKVRLPLSKTALSSGEDRESLGYNIISRTHYNIITIVTTLSKDEERGLI